MRSRMLLPLVLLLAACSSSNDFGISETPTLGDCTRGEVQVRAGISDARDGKTVSSDWLEFSVEVVNMAKGKDLVVKSIRIDPRGTVNVPYVFEPIGRTFNVTIPENEEHVFQLETTGKLVAPSQKQPAIGDGNHLTFFVAITLESGETYRCPFENRVPRW